MASPRQQRSARNRRQLTSYAPERVALAALNIFSQGPSDVVINMAAISEPAGPSTQPLPFQLRGIPGLLRVADLTMPATATLNGAGNQITLTYPGGPLTRGEAFMIGPWDPALRTSLGGFIAPGFLSYRGPDPAQVPYTVTATGAVTVTVTPSGHSVGGITFDPLGWFNVTLSELATDFLWNNVNGTVTFPSAVNPGDVLQYVGGVLTGGSATMTQFDQAEVVCT
jgi:hypothetical protein